MLLGILSFPYKLNLFDYLEVITLVLLLMINLFRFS